MSFVELQMTQDLCRLDCVSFWNHEIFRTSSARLIVFCGNLCTTLRVEGIFNIVSVSGSLSQYPNFLKTCLLVLSLNFSARVRAQENCKNIMMDRRLL